MARRYMTIWLPDLATDQKSITQQHLKDIPFVLAAPERGRMVVKAANIKARQEGIEVGTVVADARAVWPGLEVQEFDPDAVAGLLLGLAEWCIRFTPIVALDPPNGLVFDMTGCAHLWGGERNYYKDVINKIRAKGYYARGAIADTVGAAWAVSRFGKITPITRPGEQLQAILTLPPSALRLDTLILERMQKLGFGQIRNFIGMPRNMLRRRFGDQLLTRLDQALGQGLELINPVQPLVPHQERLPCLEPIVTATGIEIALQRLLTALCKRLSEEGKGMRTGILKGYRVDGTVEQIEIGTNMASHHVTHLFGLFALKIGSMAPGFGIELFVLEAPVVEDMPVIQKVLWSGGKHTIIEIMELLDRMTSRSGMEIIHRYLPDEHHWPERSIREVNTIQDEPATDWLTERRRPAVLLGTPQGIHSTYPIPDYPPVSFVYQKEIHYITNADGPERIEQEWWLQSGEHRDYYCVESQSGSRFWVFRSGHYDKNHSRWFLHGFFS